MSLYISLKHQETVKKTHFQYSDFSFLLLFIGFCLCNIQFAFGQAGGLDATFIPGSGANNQVRAMAVQTDGKILIGGDFTSYQGVPVGPIGLTRLNANGSKDLTFNLSGFPSPFVGTVYAVAVQPDGKILVAGTFGSFTSVWRLDANGVVDPGFTPFNSGPVVCLALQSDNRILVGGQFIKSLPGGGSTRLVARLNSNGTIDGTFSVNVGPESDNIVNALAIQPHDGKIIIGGRFSLINGVSSPRYGRLLPNGSLDANFTADNIIPPAFPCCPFGILEPLAITVLNNRKILLGGSGNSNQVGLWRLNEDGALDPTFLSNASSPSNLGPLGAIASLAIQSDGKILAAGYFTSVRTQPLQPSTPRNRIVRLESDGSVDLSFDPGTGANDVVEKVIWQPSTGKALIAGRFNSYNGVNRNRVARINSPVATPCTPPDLALNSGPASLNQTVCAGSPIDQIIIPIRGGATGATVTSLPPGIVGSIFTGNLFVIRGTSSAEGSYSFTVTSTGGCGPSVSISGSLNISANVSWYKDEDNDNFGDPLTTVVACQMPTHSGFNWVRNNNDCNDLDPNINPGQPEIPDDEIDNDCDGEVDEAPDPPGTTYCDLDGDGFGDPGCPIPPAGRMVNKNGLLVALSTEEGVVNNTDCNDTNPDLNPLAFEIANEADSDCDGVADDGVALLTWYADADDDGYGNESDTLVSTTQVQGYVLAGGDCNDNNPNVNPAAIEICGNGIDDNCNGEIDENNSTASAGFNQTIDQNTGTVLLIGFPVGGTWSGSGVSSSGSFNTTQAPGTYPLIYSISSPCPASATVSITLLPNQIEVLSAPIISPGTGTYQGNQLITMTSSDPGSVIYYTDNGNLPRFDIPNSFTKLYTNPFLISKNTTLRAVAVRAGSPNSPVTLANITLINPQLVANPVISPIGGSFEGSVTVSLSTTTPNAQIYYTTNGNLPRFDVPNSFTKLYAGPFTLFGSTTVRAIGIRQDWVNSGVVVANFTVTNPAVVAPVVFNPVPGVYQSSVDLIMATSTPDATIYYTTNGNVPLLNPFPNSFTRIYTGAVNLSSSRTIRALATRPGFQNSVVSVGIYTIGAARIAVDGLAEQPYYFEEPTNDIDGLATLELFPNPTSEEVSVIVNGIVDKGIVEVLNYMGKCVITLPLEGKQKLQVQHLPAGMYVVKVIVGQYVLEKRLIKH